MSSKAYVEIDFFHMEKLNDAPSRPSSPERPPSSFRGIQSVVSRINPQLLKTVMGAAAAGQPRPSDNNCPAAARPTSSTPPPPILPEHPPSPTWGSSPVPGTAPLTIFYNGAVVTVAVPRRKAEAIMRMAEAGVVVDERSEVASQLGVDAQPEEGDLPIARKKSLHRFLEKRKERLVSASPYHDKKLMASCRC